MKTRSIVLFNIILSLISVLSFVIAKYSINAIPFSSFNIYYFGNIINLSFTAVLIFLLIIHFLKLNERRNLYRSISLLLIISIVVNLIVILGIPKNIFGRQNKIFQINFIRLVYAGILFTSQFIIIYSAAVLWKSLFSKSKEIFLRAFNFSLITIISLIIFVFIYFRIENVNRPELKKKYDLAVVLGAAVYRSGRPSPVFASRIRKAYELYKNKIAENFLLTGGKAPGEITEAQSAENYLIEMGINNSAEKPSLTLDERSTTTSESIKYLKDNFPPVKNILIVSDEFHLARVREIAKFFNINIDVIPSGYQLSWEKLLYYRFRESISLLIFWILGT